MSAPLDGRTIIQLDGTYVFPLPDTISYQTAYGWEKAEFGIIGNVLSLSLDGKITDNMATHVALAQMMNTSTTAAGIQGERNSRAVNPKEAVLFKGVSHREYSLAFRIAGKSAAEVQKKLRYVDGLQAAAAPSINSTDIFFTYPETGTLVITEGQKDIFKERKIAITSIDINMTPDGFYATWSDGTPLSFGLTIGVIELELPTKENDAGMLTF